MFTLYFFFHKFDFRLRIIYQTQITQTQELNNFSTTSQQLLNNFSTASQQLLNSFSTASQQLLSNSTMSQVTTELYRTYYAQGDVVLADRGWEDGDEDELFVAKDDAKVYLPGTVKGKPVFEDGVLESIGQPPFKTWRRNGGTMVAQSKNWTSIIPGGFRGGNTPNKMNPISFDIGGYSALMGLVHVIVIPNKRITNCVTVMDKDVPLIMEGVQLLETSFNLLANGGADEIGSVRWQLSQSG